MIHVICTPEIILIMRLMKNFLIQKMYDFKGDKMAHQFFVLKGFEIFEFCVYWKVSKVTSIF